MTKAPVADWVAPFLVITVVYVLAFFLTFSVWMPIQDMFFPAFGNFASLLFFPHGVRVITAWLYGWRSLLFLGPVAVATHGFLYGFSGFSLDYMVAVFFGIFCAALSFWFFALLGMDFRLHKSNRVNWRDVILAGSAASILNSVGTKVFFGNDLATASARFVGDILGMIASMLLLMLFFRMMRRMKRTQRV